MDTQIPNPEQEVQTNPPLVQFELKKRTGVPAYTKAEDKLILDEVMKFPDNIAHGCNQASKKLKNRKPSSVQSRYYYLVRKDGKKSVIINGSAAGFSNSKINARKDGKLIRKEPLKPLAVIIKQLIEFNPEERKKIQEFFKNVRLMDKQPIQTKKELIAEHINACVIAGICPVCNGELIIVENEAKTHKFLECSDDKTHYHKIVGYVTDED